MKNQQLGLHLLPRTMADITLVILGPHHTVRIITDVGTFETEESTDVKNLGYGVAAKTWALSKVCSGDAHLISQVS